jgi:glyoxylase I family protein
MILGIHHPALCVPDLEAALAFYRDALGFECIMQAELPSGLDSFSEAFGIEDAGCKLAMLKKGNACLEIFEFNHEASPAAEGPRPANRQGISHFCLTTDDYEKDAAMLEAAGVVFNSATMGAAPGRWAYARDPFGNLIELLEHSDESPSALRYA